MSQIKSNQMKMDTEMRTTRTNAHPYHQVTKRMSERVPIVKTLHHCTKTRVGMKTFFDLSRKRKLPRKASRFSQKNCIFLAKDLALTVLKIVKVFFENVTTLKNLRA
jgi:hypothetical protein